MSTAVLLLEIGCEEIPARMIPAAAADLGSIVERILDQAGLAHGATRSWGGSRRLTVRVEAVEGRQADRDETVLGPPARVAFDSDGNPTRAAEGFARKQGVDPGALSRIETDKGEYAGLQRRVEGSTLEQLLARDLPPAVAGMTFPKTMRWGDGADRWVRPVHWVVALHGREVLQLELFGVKSGNRSVGHRFHSSGPVPLDEPDAYESALEASGVIADPARRRDRVAAALREAATRLGGVCVEDPALLDEVADLVEWPGVVEGHFDADFLELPRELLVTTLRHHQKCFSVQDEQGELLPVFLAVANTDRDPGGHVRRGNEWVVGGRLEDARFFWREDRKRPLADRSERLADVVFHAKVGSFADKAAGMSRIAEAIAGQLDLSPSEKEHCAAAARWAKNDLLTGTVGEFPELQGMVGGLMLREEGQPEELSRGVYAHYQPSGPEDPIPPTTVGCVVSVADKLDSVTGLIAAGQIPSGSRDPFGLRRACSGIFRVLLERGWPLALAGLNDLAGGGEDCAAFLLDRLQNFLRERGYTANEIRSVLRPRVDAREALGWPLSDIESRLAAIRPVRSRADFVQLADLTKRVDNILAKGAEILDAARQAAAGEQESEEDEPAAVRLSELMESRSEEMDRRAGARDYSGVIDLLAEFVDPVERFFDDVLVLDPDHPQATLRRTELLAQLSAILTRCFDIRELAGEAERRQDRG